MSTNDTAMLWPTSLRTDLWQRVTWPGSMRWSLMRSSRQGACNHGRQVTQLAWLQLSGWAEM